MAKKISYILLTIILLLLLSNIWFIYVLQKNVKTYINLNLSSSSDEQLMEKTVKKITKNYKNINKNIKKIVFKDFSEDLPIILTHFLNEKNNNYLIVLQNSNELRATGGFMGSYFFLEFSRGMWNIGNIQDIYTIAGQQTNFPTSPPGHYEYLSEGKGLLIQDANWWPDVATSATAMLKLRQEIAQTSPYIDQNYQIAGVIFVNLDFIENLLAQIGPIQLSDYDQAISAENFAEMARASRADFFAGSKEKANFLNHSKVAITNKLTQLSSQEQWQLLKLINDNLINKNVQIFSQNQEIQAIWQKHNFAGQLQKKNPQSFYFFSVESNVGINKANRLIDREFHFYRQDQEIKQIMIKFLNHNQVPKSINDNPDLKTADHLTYVNYQRLYFSPEVKIKQIQTIDAQQEKNNLEFTSQPYFNQSGQEFLEVSFLLAVPEQEQLQVVIDLENASAHQDLEIQKQSGIKQIAIFLYQNQELISNWTLTSDQLE